MRRYKAGDAMGVRKGNSFARKIIENPKVSFAAAVLVGEVILVYLIISYIPYTKIDWDAYMSQVTGFLGGERCYSKLEGDTGPLVYPAGFLYIYSVVQQVTGGQVYPAQLLFGGLYVVNLAMVLFIYLKTDVLPWWGLGLLALSKRLHSIFVLRLFNDCFAMTIFHASFISFLYQKWHLGLIIFSAAVSVKMNVLLFAPPLLLLLLQAMDVFGVITAGAGAALVQLLLGLPFLLSYPVEYISRAFDLGRVFIHFWSVNFKFVPEPLFVSKGFARFLLAGHLLLLAAFTHYKWCRNGGGLLSLLHTKLAQMKSKVFESSSPVRWFKSLHSNTRQLSSRHITTTLFVGNFIGIVFARSLHYQFYSWYFYSLPYLLWQMPYPTWLRLILFILVEICWNIYPSTPHSSLLLLGVHLIILYSLWKAPAEYPYVDSTEAESMSTRKKSR